MIINGKSVSGSESFDVENPATATVLAQAPNCTNEELDTAVDAARGAFSGWRKAGIEHRRKKLIEFAVVIEQNVSQLAALLTQEQGKPNDDSIFDIMAGAFWLTETAKLDLPDKISEDSETRTAITKYEPIGVVAGIVPWNFPIMLAMFKVAPALLAGNTIILKPAPTTPLTTLRIGELAKDIFPQGVFNIISGDNRLGPWITSHPGIDKISFTGSTATGRRVMESAAPGLKRLTLELGGNDASIVMPSVDVDAIAENIFWSAFLNAGQICIATKRLYVHQDIYEPLKNAVAKFAATVKVGNGSQQGTKIGPLQNRAQYNRVKSLIEDSHTNQYKFVLGGQVPDTPGYFIPLSILDNPPEDARIVQEEQFGPILPMMKFDDVDEVIERMNDSEFGLGAMIWSNDLSEAEDIADRLNVGTVWINELQHLSPHSNFGGRKQSGVGVEGGTEGLLEYTVTKTVFKAKAA